jgi:RNA polymerase sigma factor (sigma-70 family)
MPDANLTEFLDVRDRLIRTARRIVGHETDAEDIVQDAWLRWSQTDRGVVRNPPAFLTRTTTLLAINAIQTAHVRPRGLVAAGSLDRPDRGDDPSVTVERAEELRAAVRLLVERLTARERCAYVLREAFGYPHRRIGELLGLTEANTRQLIRRARTRLRVDQGRTASPAELLALLGAFLEVARTGDPAALADTAREGLRAA